MKAKSKTKPRRIATVSRMAKMSFPALKFDASPFAQPAWEKSSVADGAWMRIAAATLQRSSDFLARDGQDHETVAKMLDGIQETLDRYMAFIDVLEAAQARLLIAGSKMHKKSTSSAKGIPEKPFANNSHLPRALQDTNTTDQAIKRPPGMDDPDLYAVTVAGDCMNPVAADQSVALATPNGWPGNGDLAVIYVRGAKQGMLKRIVTIPPREECLRPPHPDDGVVFMLECEQLNPPKFYRIECPKIEAVHRVLHVQPTEVRP